VLLPFIILLAVLLLLHLLIYLLLPLRWDDIRAVFHRKLEERVRQELESVYLNVPTDVADNLEQERRRGGEADGGTGRGGAGAGVLERKVEERVRQELESVYLNVPTDVADNLEQERRRVEKLIEDTREVASWLEKREQSASIAGLYGRKPQATCSDLGPLDLD